MSRRNIWQSLNPYDTRHNSETTTNTLHPAIGNDQWQSTQAEYQRLLGVSSGGSKPRTLIGADSQRPINYGNNKSDTEIRTDTEIKLVPSNNKVPKFALEQTNNVRETEYNLSAQDAAQSAVATATGVAAAGGSIGSVVSGATRVGGLTGVAAGTASNVLTGLHLHPNDPTKHPSLQNQKAAHDYTYDESSPANKVVPEFSETPLPPNARVVHEDHKVPDFAIKQAAIEAETERVRNKEEHPEHGVNSGEGKEPKVWSTVQHYVLNGRSMEMPHKDYAAYKTYLHTHRMHSDRHHIFKFSQTHTTSGMEKNPSPPDDAPPSPPDDAPPSPPDDAPPSLLDDSRVIADPHPTSTPNNTTTPPIKHDGEKLVKSTIKRANEVSREKDTKIDELLRKNTHLQNTINNLYDPRIIQPHSASTPNMKTPPQRYLTHRVARHYHPRPGFLGTHPASTPNMTHHVPRHHNPKIYDV